MTVGPSLIAPHLNEDSIKADMRSDCSMYPTTWIWVVPSNAVVRKWCIIKIEIDFKSAFLKSVPAQRDVYFNSPVEPSYHNDLWPLLAAANGLFCPNAKFQVSSVSALLSLRLKPVPEIAQLFDSEAEDSGVCLFTIKIIDDILAIGTDIALCTFHIDFCEKFSRGTMFHGPSNLLLFGLKIVQNQEFTISIATTSYHLWVYIHWLVFVVVNVKKNLNSIENQAFMSTNFLTGWLRIIISPIRAF